jgi:hypothetical protein
LVVPEGVMRWFDPAAGGGAVVRGGRIFSTIASEVEAGARRAGAHVHFDIRDEAGAQRAVNVTLCRGARGARHHRRAGSLAGGHGPDAKAGFRRPREHPERSVSKVSHPLEVAAELARVLQAGEADAALSLYASDAVVHAGGADVSGRTHLLAHLERGGLLGVETAPVIRAEDGLAVLTWTRAGPQKGALEVRCRVEHGLIVEQWTGPAAPAAPAAEIEEDGYQPPRTFVTRGGVGADVVGYAKRRLGRVIDQIAEPVWFVRTKLSLASDPGRKRPALAEVTLDVDGDLVRAHVAATDLREAIDLLQRRLRDQLEHRAQHRETLHRSTGTGGAGEWRHGQLRGRRPEYFQRRPEERQLVRHKTFAVDEMTPEEAAFDMDQLDYGFHLFRDLASGEDALLQREPGGSLLLTRLHPAELEPRPAGITLTVDARTPATLTVDDAIETLNVGHQPFVFFANATTGRGNVVYRRYDGHYGLITPE